METVLPGDVIPPPFLDVSDLMQVGSLNPTASFPVQEDDQL